MFDERWNNIWVPRTKRAREAFKRGIERLQAPGDPLHGFCMLAGTEGLDWCYEETDPGWWALRLYLRRN